MIQTDCKQNRKHKVSGILYGVGTGPGDPELMTLKAVRILQEADLLILPTDSPDNCRSYRTAAAAVPEIADREILCVPFSMDPDPQIRRRSRKENAERIAGYLDAGRTAAFLTIGDPAVYSTFGYVMEILEDKGYDIRIVSGVPSFCGAAASLHLSLCSGDETLRIVSGNSEMTDDGSEPDNVILTTVYMKPGSR